MRTAIVGMACLFPGAPNLDTFFRNLTRGHDAITQVPAKRIDPVFFDENARGGDRFYCRRGGFVDDYATFEATRFGVMPVAAQGAEPDQLLALQVAASAMEDAGYHDRPFARDRAAVILGRGGYAGPGRMRLEQHVRSAEQMLAALRALIPTIDEPTLARVKTEFRSQLGAAGSDAAIGLVPNLAASRIAQRLDLHGPAFTVDAACASALIAVDEGCRELELGRADLVVCGGIHLCQDEAFWSVFCQLGALSKSEQIRPFDRRADGLLIGEGVGIFVLKRALDAERDGDRIYAVICGTGVASDGRAATLMSPAVEGQVLALERAWREAGFDPKSVGLLEAHGTATPAGDAAELTTLARVFGQAEGDGPRAILGSVKSMIGHAMPAAGAAGLMKAALAVHHGVLLPTLHCEEPHELMAATRFRTSARQEPWDTKEPRRAGVNAFGFGGINAHVVIEEHGFSAARASSAARTSAGASALRTNGSASHAKGIASFAVFSASTAEALAADLVAKKTRVDGGAARAFVFDATPERLARAHDIVTRGKPWRGRDGVWFSPRGLLSDGGTLAFLFPGVDSSFEPHVEDVAAHFGLPVPSHTTAKALDEMGMGIIGVNRLLDQVLRRLGVVPADVAGHSIGEWSAMIATGIIPEPALDAFIATLRPGSLEVPGVVFVAAGCSLDRAEAAIEGLQSIAISHDNCPHQVILCGRSEPIEKALERLRADGVLSQKLPFQSGFHSPLFADFVAPHRENFARLPLVAPNVPVWSATTCALYPSGPEEVRALAIDHLVRPVRFRELIETLYQKGVRVFVQVGTGSLANFVEDTLRGRPHLAMPANVKDRGGMEQLQRTAAALFVEGAAIDLARLAPKAPQRMTLSLGVPLARVFSPLALAADKNDAAPSARHDLPGVAPSLAGDFALGMAAIADAQRDVLTMLAEPRSTRTAPPAPTPALAAAPTPALAAAPTKDASPTRENVWTRTISVETMPELADHSFFRQPPGWENLSDRYPVVPMTTSIDLMIEHAELMAPGRVAVAVEDLRAYRWLVVSTAIEAKITCQYDGKDRVRVKIGDFNEATVILADAYPAAPPADTAPLPGAISADLSADALYDDRWMFHGPAYRGVTDVGVLGSGGIRGALSAIPARGALLDNAGQLFGYWVMVNHETNRMAMPIRLAELRLYGPQPRDGRTMSCTVRIRSIDEKSVLADMSLSHDGQVWATIRGWEDRRFETDARLWEVMRFPEKNLLAMRQPEGFVLFEDHYGGATTRDQLSRRFLGERERAEYEKQGPRKQRQFLNGRIAAKDAVRDLLWREGGASIFPVEIEVESAPSGEPLVRTKLASDLHVSIAHKDLLAVAFARRGHAVGIDLERIEPREDSFAGLTFTAGELALVRGDSRDEAWTRLWAAKEAFAKARGTGLLGAPKKIAVTDRAGERFLVDGVWVQTKRHCDFIIAWTDT